MLNELKKLQREMNEAQKALEALDGELGTVSFDPNDPESIETAIQKIENIIDEKIGAYASGSITNSIAEQLKEHYRNTILEQAAAARIEEE